MSKVTDLLFTNLDIIIIIIIIINLFHINSKIEIPDNKKLH